MSIMPGFEGVPPEDWEALLRASEAPPGPPAPPVYQPPTLAQPPASTFRSRLADALAALPPPVSTPGTTGGQAALSGLLSGAARGFAGQTKARESREEKVRQESNALARAESDRNWQNAQATYRAKLTEHYRTEADQRGKVRVTRQMATDMGVPEAVGTFIDPIDASDRIAKRGRLGVADKAVAKALGVAEGTLLEPGTILGARNYLKPPASASNVGSTTISPRAQSIINAIKAGKMRPDIIRSLPPRDPVRSEVTQGLADAGVDINTMQFDINAETAYWRVQNDSKRTSMRTLLNTLEHSVPYTRKLITDLREAVPDFAISGLNRAQLAVVANSRGPDAVLARKLVAQIADIGAEIGGLYMGGNSNTDESFRVAQQNINSNWSEEQLLAALDQIEVNAGIRKRAMEDVRPYTRSGQAGDWRPSLDSFVRP